MKKIFVLIFTLFVLTGCYIGEPPRPEATLSFGQNVYNYDFGVEYELDFSWENKRFDTYTTNYTFHMTDNTAGATVKWKKNESNKYNAYIKANTYGKCKLQIEYFKTELQGRYFSQEVLFNFGMDRKFTINFFDSDGRTLLQSNEVKVGDNIIIPQLGDEHIGWRRDSSFVSKNAEELSIYEDKDYYAMVDNREATEGLEFEYIDDKTCKVVGYSGFDVDINIPALFNGRYVTSIGKSAFEDRAIEKVSIPSTCMSINSYAFNSSAISRVEIPQVSLLSEIGTAAFDSCTNLEWILLPLTISRIGNNAFSNADISVLFESSDNENISFGYSVYAYNNRGSWLDIDRYAGFDQTGKFEYFITKTDTAAIFRCYLDGLTSLEISSVDGYPVTSIMTQSDNGDELTTLVIGPNVRTIGQSCFRNCDSLVNVDFSNATSLKTVSSYAFDECDNIEIIDMLNCKNLTRIYGHAFTNMDKLKILAIPESVQTINTYAYEDSGFTLLCGHTKQQYSEINFDPYNSDAADHYAFYNIKSIVSSDQNNDYMYAINNDNKVMLLECLSSVGTVVDLTTKIDGRDVYCLGPSLFEGKQIVEVSLPKTIEHIGSAAFQNCNALRYVNIPGGSALTTINSYAFNGCVNLVSFFVTRNVSSIGYKALTANENMQLLFENIDHSNISFSYSGNAWYSNATFIYGIKDVKFHDIGNGRLQYFETHKEELGAIRYTHNVYSNHAPTTDVDLTEIDGKPFIYICKRAFYNLQNGNGFNITITIGKNIKTIDNEAFAYFYNTLGTSSFDKAFYIVKFEANSELKTIGKSAFCHGGRTGEIVIPISVTKIGSEAFYDNQSSHNIFMEKESSDDMSLGNNWSKNCTVYWGGQWEYGDGDKPTPII